MLLLKNRKNTISTVEEKYAHRQRPKPPVILSNKRYCAVLSRARDCKNRIARCKIEEERRYRAYLKEGNDALLKLFAGNISRTQEEKIEELRQQREEEMRQARENKAMTKALDEQLRKERIERATNILEGMKPGPHALFTALRESEMMRVREYQQRLNEEFELEQKRQQSFDDAFCPETPILSVPLAVENQIKTEEEAKQKKLDYKKEFDKYMEERKQRKQREKDQKIIDGIIEREQIKCMQEQEEKRAMEVARCKRDQCRRYIREVKEAKALALLNEKIADVIDDRKNCIFNVANRQLNNDVKDYVKKKREKEQQENAARAIVICRAQQTDKEKELARIESDCERYELELFVDTERRKCRQHELYLERRQAQAEDAKRLAREARERAELERFDFALRLKNQEAEMLRKRHVKRQEDRAREKLVNILNKQRFEERQRKIDEALQKGTCPDDPYMCEDKYFFEQAANIVEDSKAAGRPLYPIIKVIEQYKRNNNIEAVLQPHKVVAKRNTAYDACQPGYIERAELKYAEYARKADCKAAKQQEYDEMVANCLKINKIAQLEREENERKKRPEPVVCNRLRYPGYHDGLQQLDSSVDLATNYDPNIDFCRVKGKNQPKNY